MTTGNAKPQQRRFRVTFQGGTTITTTATSSLQAQQNAARVRPGIIKEVKFLKGASK